MEGFVKVFPSLDEDLIEFEKRGKALAEQY